MERDTKRKTKRSGQAQLVYVKRHKAQHPLMSEDEPMGLEKEGDRECNTQLFLCKYVYGTGIQVVRGGRN